MEKTEKIQKLYAELDNKMDFLMRLSSKYGLNFLSIKNHHFAGRKIIPEKYRDIYLRELKKEHKKLLQ